MSPLDETVEAYKQLYGEPEFRYFKREIIWTKERRKPGYHIRPIADGIEVSRADYEANVAASDHARGEAFMGRLQQRYWEYHRKMVKDGWRERLIKDVQGYGQSHLSHERGADNAKS